MTSNCLKDVYSDYLTLFYEVAVSVLTIANCSSCPADGAVFTLLQSS